MEADSPAEAPIPQKIVDKIRSGQFVEMRELLADNISLLEQLHSITPPHEGCPHIAIMVVLLPDLHSNPHPHKR